MHLFMFIALVGTALAGYGVPAASPKTQYNAYPSGGSYPPSGQYYPRPATSPIFNQIFYHSGASCRSRYLKGKCHGKSRCIHISIGKRHGSRRVTITCPHKKGYSVKLVNSKGQTIEKDNKRISKKVTCRSSRWYGRNKSGQKTKAHGLTCRYSKRGSKKN